MSASILRAAAVQLSSQDDLAKNLDACERAVELAARSGAKLVVLPENFAWFGSDRDKRQIAEDIGDTAAPIQGRLSAMAKSGQVTLVGGGMPEASSVPDKPFNTCVVFDPKGGVIASYRKIHLFDVELPDGVKMLESETTSAGTDTKVIDVEGVKVGLSVCYDLRFPELYRTLTAAGAEVLLIPAAFTLQTGKDHWHLLLRARAIESTAWVIAANQWGTHPRGRTCYGHSLVVDPWGVVVTECSDRTGVVVADLDMTYTAAVRARLPSIRHRRMGC